jgi:hypothetical protein
VPDPIIAAPSMKVTDPVGVPPLPDTFAVKLTGWPKTLGLGEAIIAVVVEVVFTATHVAVTWSLFSGSTKMPFVRSPGTTV